MSNSFTLNAEKRDDQGKGASRRLRHAGKVPAILYGGGADPVSLTLSHNEIFHHLENDAFYSHILEINMGDETAEAILKDVQRHPYKPTILHIDLLRIKRGQTIHVNVPLHFINEDKCKGTKNGGIIQHLKSDVEIIVLPRNLPEYIEVDVADLEIGDSLHLSDLNISDDIELVALTHGEETDKTVVSIQPPTIEQEPETDAPEADEVPTVGEEAGNNAETENKDD